MKHAYLYLPPVERDPEGGPIIAVMPAMEYAIRQAMGLRTAAEAASDVFGISAGLAESLCLRLGIDPMSQRPRCPAATVIGSFIHKDPLEIDRLLSIDDLAVKEDG